MALANRYLGTHEHRTRLAVLDAGEHGKWLRQDVYEELFTASAGPVRSTVQDALWTPFEVDASRFGSRGPEPVVAQPPEIDGMLGGHCETVQQVGQWSPTLRRSLSFVPGLTPPIALDQDLSLGELPAYAQGLRKRFPTLYACCLHGEEMEALAGDVNDLRSPGSTQLFNQYSDFPRTFSVMPRSGFFTLVGLMSPCGGNTNEDTAVYDTTDSEHWLLVVALRDGDTVWLLRRIYHD